MALDGSRCDCKAWDARIAQITRIAAAGRMPFLTLRSCSRFAKLAHLRRRLATKATKTCPHGCSPGPQPLLNTPWSDNSGRHHSVSQGRVQKPTRHSDHLDDGALSRTVPCRPLTRANTRLPNDWTRRSERVCSLCVSTQTEDIETLFALSLTTGQHHSSPAPLPSHRF